MPNEMDQLKQLALISALRPIISDLKWSFCSVYYFSACVEEQNKSCGVNWPIIKLDG